MKITSITMKQFVSLVGVLGVQCFRRHSNGSSWILLDGRIAAEKFNGKDWEWAIIEETA